MKKVGSSEKERDYSNNMLLNTADY